MKIFFTSLFILFYGSLHAATIILTSDQQLNDLLNPDKRIDLSTGREKKFSSLREICETAKQRNDKVLTIAFDEFFRQYREQAGTERRLTPDMDEYIQKIKVIANFAKQYDMGIGLSLLSPLELGSAFKKNKGESGRWFNYQVAYRDPSTGKFSLQMWQQLSWTNNKGKFEIKLKSVQAYAFKEKEVGNTPFKAVIPTDIIELKNVKYEALDTVKTLPSGDLWAVPASSTGTQDMHFDSRNLKVYTDGEMLSTPYNRVLVLLEYETPEMDYFSPKAASFLKSLLKKYSDNGIKLVSLYSDEMHIQQDWYYFVHHQNGQFNSKYLTPNLSAAFKKQYGQEFENKHLLYFVYGSTPYQTTVKSVVNSQYVMGSSPLDIHKTYLLRDNYYKLLNHGVADLFKNAKDYGDEIFKVHLEAHGHSSWAESPTIDLWNTEKLPEMPAKYEYTSNFLWSNTVQQASAACYDYFKWGEYLQPTGNDFAECGWLDRNYYGAAMGASIGVINKTQKAYIAAWGMPEKSRTWKGAINRAFGGSFGGRDDGMTNKITGDVHRDVEALILYPMNLVAVEERFGSWMTQYAYTNYLTADKLLEMGDITNDGYLKVGEKKYKTLVAIFEPLPTKGLLDMMDTFTKKGGKVIWFGPPPLINNAGENCTTQWQNLFGVNYKFDPYMGEIAVGKKINFKGLFSKIPEQTILTDFLVDHIYPVLPNKETNILALSGDKILGTSLKNGQGVAYYFGFRPRDDQSESLGYETRTLFEILNCANTYSPTGKFPDVNDNPNYISRTSDYLATKFPNGSTVLVKHYRTHAETWEGGFSRNKEADDKALALNPLPSDSISLVNMKVNGHQISYTGRLTLAFRTDVSNKLIAFEGYNCKEIKIDGNIYAFADHPLSYLAFAPESNSVNRYSLVVNGSGKLTLPIAAFKGKKITVSANEEKVPVKLVNGSFELEILPAASGKKLTLIVQ